VRSTLFISGDGLRVVEDDTKVTKVTSISAVLVLLAKQECNLGEIQLNFTVFYLGFDCGSND